MVLLANTAFALDGVGGTDPANVPGTTEWCQKIWTDINNNKFTTGGVDSFKTSCQSFIASRNITEEELKRLARTEDEANTNSKALISDDEEVTCAELLLDKKINSSFATLFCPSGSSGSAITVMIGKIADYIVGIIGTIMIIMIIVSGIQMAASAGNPDAISAAKKRLVNVIISLALLLSIRAIMALLGVPI